MTARTVGRGFTKDLTRDCIRDRTKDFSRDCIRDFTRDHIRVLIGIPGDFYHL